jgi:hypothetical protein
MALALGLVNAIIRPILAFLSCGCIVATLGLFMIVINVITFWLAAWFTNLLFPNALVLDSFWAALWEHHRSIVGFGRSCCLTRNRLDNERCRVSPTPTMNRSARRTLAKYARGRSTLARVLAPVRPAAWPTSADTRGQVSARRRVVLRRRAGCGASIGSAIATAAWPARPTTSIRTASCRPRSSR